MCVDEDTSVTNVLKTLASSVAIAAKFAAAVAEALETREGSLEPVNFG